MKYNIMRELSTLDRLANNLNTHWNDFYAYMQETGPDENGEVQPNWFSEEKLRELGDKELMVVSFGEPNKNIVKKTFVDPENFEEIDSIVRQYTIPDYKAENYDPVRWKLAVSRIPEFKDKCGTSWLLSSWIMLPNGMGVTADMVKIKDILQEIHCQQEKQAETETSQPVCNPV